MATVTNSTYFTTLGIAWSYMVSNLWNTSLFGNIFLPGSMTAAWFPAIDAQGSWFELQGFTAPGSDTIWKLYVQEIGPVSNLPLTFVSSPPIQSQILVGTLPNVAGRADAAEYAALLASAYQNMVIGTTGATTQRMTPFTVVVPGKTRAWYSLEGVWSKNAIAYGGVMVAAMDYRESPPIPVGTPFARQTFMPNGALQIFLPQGQQQLLQDFEVGINNGSAIYSVSSNTFTEP